MRLAIMQPYLWSAWGYYRLFAAADMFIIYDDAQYMKGGWVNRNIFSTKYDTQDWFTLPLKKAPLKTRIMDITWAENYEENLKHGMDKFPVFKELGIKYPWYATWQTKKTPYHAIEDSLHWTTKEVGIDCKILTSSMLGIPPRLKGQEKVIEICKYFRAAEYINLSGGRELYNKKDFNEWGIDLQFLPEVQDTTNILERIAQLGSKQVREEIYANI